MRSFIPEWMKCCARSVSSLKCKIKAITASIAHKALTTSKKWLPAALGASLLVAPYNIVCAAPQDGVIVGGQGQISHSQLQTDIYQHTERMAIDWTAFDIAKNETVNYHQPGSDSIALNRILGNEASAIYGRLNANGQVYLVNPNGIIFAPGSEINVAGLIATTSHINPGEFMSNGTLATHEHNASIVAAGSIFASGGLVAIQGATAINVSGVITARDIRSGDGGRIAIIADANKGRLDLSGATLLATASRAVGNGGMIEVSAAELHGLDSLIINAASGAYGHKGQIIIDPNDFHITNGSGAWVAGSTIGNRTLNNILNTGGADVTVATTGAGGDLYVDTGATISWTANNSLTLTASKNIFINADIVNTAGTGNVTLRADGDAAGSGTIAFAAGSMISLNPAANGGNLQIYYYPVAGNYALSNRSDFSSNFSGNTSANHATVYMLLDSVNDYLQLSNTPGYCNGANSWTGSNFALGADINLSGSAVNAIGDGNGSYYGKFDGMSHTISNLTNNSSAAAMFGVIETSAIVENLTLENPMINVNSYGVSPELFAGTIAFWNAGVIDQVTVSGGSVNVFDYYISSNATLDLWAGGLVYANAGVIRNSNVLNFTVGCAGTWGGIYYPNVTVYASAGGVAGMNQGSIIGGTLNNVTVSAAGGNCYAGGVAASNGLSGATISGVTIINAHVSSEYGFGFPTSEIVAGGVVAVNTQGQIGNCAVSGTTVNSNSKYNVAWAGGIVGKNSSGAIEDCVASGSTISGGMQSSNLYLGGIAAGTWSGAVSANMVSNVIFDGHADIYNYESPGNIILSRDSAIVDSSIASLNTAVYSDALGYVSMNCEADGSIEVGFTGSSPTLTWNGNAPLSLGMAVASQSLALVANGGFISQTSALSTPTININAPGSDVYLDNHANSCDSLVIQSAQVLSLYNSGKLNLYTDKSASAPILSLDRLNIVANDDITLTSQFQLGASNTGNAIVLASNHGFYNTSTYGSDALKTAPGGRWLIFAELPNLYIGEGLASNFVQYGATYGNEIIGTGNGCIFATTPGLIGGLAGMTAKVADGSTAVSHLNNLTATATGGTINGDIIDAIEPLSAVYDSPQAGINKPVTLTSARITAHSSTGQPVYGYALATTGITGPVGVIVDADIVQQAIARQAAFVTQNEAQTAATAKADAKQLSDIASSTAGTEPETALNGLVFLNKDANGNVITAPAANVDDH